MKRKTGQGVSQESRVRNRYKKVKRQQPKRVFCSASLLINRQKISVMDLRTLNFFLLSAIIVIFIPVKGQNLRLRQALQSSGWLNDIDGDNIPGQAGVDYPVHATVPTGTSFRCSDYDYAGYFGDVETDCQAYHVCFPDGRNASFLCVNGTVFHQRFFVCDWWFHFNCSYGPNLYDLNLYRKVPLPVLPPVQRKPFPGPIPQPKADLIPLQPRSQFRGSKELNIDSIKNDEGNGRNKPKQDTRKPLNENLTPNKWKNSLDSEKPRTGNDWKTSGRGEKTGRQMNNPNNPRTGDIEDERCECKCSKPLF